MKFSIAVACLLGLTSAEADSAQDRIAYSKNHVPFRDTTTL